MAMAPGDGRVAQPAAEDHRDRLARDIAAADNHGARALDRNLIVVQQGQHAARRARDEAAPFAAIEAADTAGADRVDVLVGRDSVEKAKRIDSRRGAAIAAESR